LAGLKETRPRPFFPELSLIGATIAYGATFVLVQDALERTTPVAFILLRFGIGALVLVPLALRTGWQAHATAEGTERFSDFLRAVAVFGGVGFVAYWFQNAGLEHTTTSNSAFITGLFVVFTPLIQAVVTRRLPDRNIALAVAIAIVGLFLLTGAQLTMGKGDALTLACAFFFGAWIFLGGRYAQRFDPIALTAGQMVVLALLAVPFVLVDGMGTVDGDVLMAGLITGVLCSAVAFTLQLWGQRFVEPSRAAVILTFEPVVAGIVGYAVGERLDGNGYLGAALILTSILLAEFGAWRRRPRGPEAGPSSLDRTVKESENAATPPTGA
jgi:drug/metabolite transporter (DMT)-like permease